MNNKILDHETKEEPSVTHVNINPADMMIKYSLGIDIASKTIQCCLSSIDTEQVIITIATGKFSNTQAGFIKLAKWIQKYYRQKESP